MTAPRVCRSCGAALHGNVRWCLRCYAPSRELTPRPPTWAADGFVDAPIHTGGTVPHWSRWEKSATTLGPVGRVTTTIAAVVWLLGAAFNSPVTLVFVLPVVSVAVHAIWAKGWVVPGARTHTPPVAPMSSWLWDRSDVLATLAIAVISCVGFGLLMYLDDDVVRFVVIVTVVVVGIFLVFRRAGGSR
jgi:hypothetical protein